MKPHATQPNVSIVENFIRDPETLMTTLRETIDWERSMAARWTASYGVPYNYAQMVYPATEMHTALVPIVDKLHDALGIRFNNCLLNFYQNERSKIGFHSDETKDLVAETGVAIVSVGQPRHLHFRRRDEPEVRTSFLLEPGSMLFMGIDV
ncbi:MAG: alpha-ketoglutarate-dependent dioxygenase AlkB [Deltaproteobacteria bacterium]|nr:alpha-ketoglutarate-dependent dioxygenase AlkB [Deltaproteobacteria bacterium]